MRVLVSGATGFVGEALTARLRAAGHEVRVLTRSPGRAGAAAVGWDPDAGRLDEAGLEGVEAVVHLAGESIAGVRWTKAKKRRILESRERGTRLLAETLARRADRPRVLVSASAVGFYGDRGDEVLTEESGPGDTFLARVCVAWEGAARPAAEAGIRVVHPRIGLVMGPGGTLGLLLPLFRAGLGGRLGRGDQWMSWIHREDLAAVLLYLMEDEALAGPVNAVAPNPVTNATFTRALGRAVSRPTLFSVPGALARLGLGEMGDELLLASQRAVPGRLGRQGFQFQHPDVGDALKAVAAAA